MSASSFSLGNTPASEFFVALIITMTRIVVLLPVVQDAPVADDRSGFQRDDEPTDPGSTCVATIFDGRPAAWSTGVGPSAAPESGNVGGRRVVGHRQHGREPSVWASKP